MSTIETAGRVPRPDPYVLTNSRRQELATCPYREFLRYTLGIQPWVAADPLVFGGLWHELMAVVYRLHAWWEGQPFGPDEEELTHDEVAGTVLGRLAHDPVPSWRGQTCYLPDGLVGLGEDDERAIVPPGGVVRDWKRRMLLQTRPLNGMLVPAHDVEKVDAMAALATAMLEGYLRRWWAVDRERYRVLAVEHRMRAPIRCPSGHPSWQWIYAGDLDLALQDRATKKVVVIDHKTCSGDPEDEVAAQQVSPQVEGYCWLWTAEHPDLPAETVVYRNSRKKAPSVPERNKCPGGKDDGVVVDHAGCRLCGGTGLGEAGKSGKPLVCKGKRADGVVERHDGCARCHGTLLGEVSEKACDTTPDVYHVVLDEAQAAGFPPSQKHMDILGGLIAAWPTKWFDEHRKRIVSVGRDPFERFTQETWRMTRAKMEMLRGGERGHWRADSPHVCSMFGRPCAYTPLCRENAADTLALFESDPAWQDTFERRTLDR